MTTKFTHNEILILGDSFAASRNEPEDWPNRLTQLLTGTDFSPDRNPRGCGFSGAGWWSIRKRLLEELKIQIPKVLIVCHTEELRLPNDYDLALNATGAELHTNAVPRIHPTPTFPDYLSIDDIAHAAKLFYKYICCYDYQIWANIQWFKELDEIIESHSIPFVIHLHCFPREFHTINQNYINHKNYLFKTGMSSTPSLYEISAKSFGEAKFKDGFIRNHFDKVQNIQLANEVYNAITNNYSNGAILNLKG